MLTISHGEEQLSIYESHRMDKGFCETTAKKKFQGFGIDRSKQHPKLTGKKSSAEWGAAVAEESPSLAI